MRDANRVIEPRRTLMVSGSFMSAVAIMGESQEIHALIPFPSIVCLSCLRDRVTANRSQRAVRGRPCGEFHRAVYTRRRLIYSCRIVQYYFNIMSVSRGRKFPREYASQTNK